LLTRRSLLFDEQASSKAEEGLSGNGSPGQGYECGGAAVSVTFEFIKY
jgi:hypothetical protein